MKAPRSGNAAWKALRDDANASGEPITQTPPLRAKDCKDCACRLCWLVAGFNARRCAACSESGCHVGRGRSEACVSWLDDALRAGRVVRTANTTPPDAGLLRDMTADAAPDADGPEPEALPHRLHAWAVTFAAELATGRVQLLEVLEIALQDALDDALPPCPSCGRPVRPNQPSIKTLGICRRCYLERLKLAADEKRDELEAQRGYESSKQQLRRLRDALDPDRERGRAPFRTCRVCGARLPSIARHPEDRCDACLERDRAGAGDTRPRMEPEAQAAAPGAASRDGQEPRTAHNPPNRTP